MKPGIDPDQIRSYFSEKLETFGATPRGVDWNSEASQEQRFTQLLKVCDRSSEFSINDYGCGYGALADYLSTQGYIFRYSGYDMLQSMVVKAQELHQDCLNCTFTWQETDLEVADYTIASGIFNVKFQASDREWTDYVVQILGKMHALSSKGFAFNMLTSYSDAEYMRPELFYADPCFFFDYCKREFSRSVALLHDYGFYDFTIIVRRQA
jgi:SAM-dependent methyltransferase